MSDVVESQSAQIIRAYKAGAYNNPEQAAAAIVSLVRADCARRLREEADKLANVRTEEERRVRSEFIRGVREAAALIEGKEG